MRETSTLALAVAGVLALSVAACSGEQQSGGDGTTTESSAADTTGGGETAGVESADDAAAEPTDAAAEESEPAAETLAIATPNGEMQGSVDAGARIWRQCMACHVLDEGVNRVGPSLHGIIGREAGSVDGFRYSEANANSGTVWTEENLFTYLENPREFIPGTIMAFAGLRIEQQRADVIAYIKANGGAAE